MRLETMTSLAQDTRDRIVSLESEFKATMNRVLNELADAKQSRSRLAERMEKVEDKVDSTEAAVKDVAKRLEEAEPTIANMNKWRERGIGAWFVIVGVSAALGGAISKIIAKLWALVSG